VITPAAGRELARALPAAAAAAARPRPQASGAPKDARRYPRHLACMLSRLIVASGQGHTPLKRTMHMATRKVRLQCAQCAEAAGFFGGFKRATRGACALAQQDPAGAVRWQPGVSGSTRGASGLRFGSMPAGGPGEPGTGNRRRAPRPRRGALAVPAGYPGSSLPVAARAWALGTPRGRVAVARLKPRRNPGHGRLHDQRPRAIKRAATGRVLNGTGPGARRQSRASGLARTAKE
jgi:hypothetical protein